MRFYFVRHGESEANLLNEFSNQDFTKHPLTENGRAQAAALAETLRAVKLTALYASPLLRAQQTAEILNAPHGLPIQTSRALVEHDAGELEGRSDPAAWDAYMNLFNAWIVQRDLDARIEGGESFNDLRARFIPFIATLSDKYQGTDANIVLVAHGGIYHSMLPLLLTNVGYTFAYKHLLGNAAYVLAEQRDEGLVCLSWADTKLTPAGSIVHEV